ncbi:alpha/beta hydrolase family protein [Povalibacter sp.]|uniref:alpha/beta hydrolase family protein n=1 Tax=Povalibacter sp. TaxID=1962978 RepID=UPI002F3FF0A8
MRQYSIMPSVIGLLAVLDLSSAAQPEGGASVESAPYGNYRISDQHQLGIDRFVTDDGKDAVLISDYSTGVVRRLFPVTQERFVMGVGFNTASPAELTLTFVKDDRGTVRGVSLRDARGVEQFAQRVSLRTEAVSFQNTDAKLEGTLLIPSTHGPHPAIVLLHGSGPLTRYSFGPYPHFFTSLGFAVLIYDKRGSGRSSGTRVDASTGVAMKNSLYPDELVGDALAAMHLLQQRKDIDPQKIGFWGSSEGGMLTTQVAARAEEVAFAINSSGFMEPLWQTLRYQATAIPRSQGAAVTKIEQEAAFVDWWLGVARTGKGWDDFQQAQQQLSAAGRGWLFQSRGPFTSLEQLRWDWNHVLTFDPLVELTKVRCPVLGVFGELDPLTPAHRTVENMSRTLTATGNKDFTFKIFPHAGHSLSELPEKNRMAPGVFDTLRTWLLARVQVTD